VAAIVNVTEPEPGATTDLAERVAVTPVGAPEIDRVRAELKPVCAEVVIEIGVELGRLAMTLVLLSATVNVGAAMTMGMLSEALCSALVPVNVMV
jgi:hypothetical protein